jgi:hypothetical protein
MFFGTNNLTHMHVSHLNKNEFRRLSLNLNQFGIIYLSTRYCCWQYCPFKNEL